MASTDLIDSLSDPARPTFLFGCVPPRDNTSEQASIEICQAFVDRGRALALDGYIVCASRPPFDPTTRGFLLQPCGWLVGGGGSTDRRAV